MAHETAPAASSAPSEAPRRVVITGAARGIGESIASSFARLGDRLALIDVDADLDATADRLDAVAIGCDLAEPDQARDAMSTAIGKLGGIDVLVNNAGIFEIVPLLDIEVEAWDRMFDVNTRAMLLTMQGAAVAMRDAGTGGRIINMASMGGKDGAAGQSHYAASKAAVISLTQVAAKEFGPFGVTVNALCPGYVLTEMGADTRTDEMVASWSALSPLGRCGTPDDVANFAVFLASPGADYLTGQAFNVTGGMITR